MRYLMIILFWIGVTGLLSCTTPPQPVPESAPLPRQSNEPLDIVCTPQRNIVEKGEKVELRVWADEDVYPDMTYLWKSDVGNLTPSGPRAVWDLTGVDPGTHQTQVKVSVSEEMEATCSISVYVSSRMRNITGRAFLVRNHKEKTEYGMYSYLLLGSVPTHETARKRYLETIRAYLSLVEIGDLENKISSKKLNITYLPLKVRPEEKASAEWLLKHYDYARAKVLLSLIPGHHLDGPYLVSSLVPLTDTLHLSGRYLLQDLSWVPEDSDILELWIKEFQRLAGQTRFWEASTARKLVLNMRTLIRVASRGFPEVKAAVDQWINWISE